MAEPERMSDEKSDDKIIAMARMLTRRSEKIIVNTHNFIIVETALSDLLALWDKKQIKLVSNLYKFPDNKDSLTSKRMSDEEVNGYFEHGTGWSDLDLADLEADWKRAREAEKQAVMRVQVLSGIREKLEKEIIELKEENERLGVINGKK